MSQEIEKKFLLTALPVGLDNGEKIIQAYLLMGDPEVRIRNRAGKCSLTKKAGTGFVREETEIEISPEMFNILLETTEYRLEKIRYKFPHEGLVWEIDQYLGKLNLFTAEVELPSMETEVKFPNNIRQVLLDDVTLNPKYKNQYLAMINKIKRH